ncbi:MAG: uroporphyrinogen-III synthase [Paludibacteraceae bacterium]|jgi:uroporphyrinogen-III synthase|nr:uroporphyrinogen-III synthase [Paludibacteraceae bacterium]
MAKKILITQVRPAGEHNPYDLLEHHHDVRVDFQPLVELEGLSAREFRAQHLNILDFTAVILNSKISADHFFRMAQDLHVAVPETMHYYCISEAVGNYLQKYIEFRKRRIFFGEHNSFDDIIPAMNRRPQEKYMMVVGENYTDDLINMFASRKVIVTPAVMFRQKTYAWPKEKPFDYDVIAFFTASGVHAFLENFPHFEQGDKAFICFGAPAAQALTDAGYSVTRTAPAPGCPSVLSAIEQYLSEA